VAVVTETLGVIVKDTVAVEIDAFAGLQVAVVATGTIGTIVVG